MNENLGLRLVWEPKNTFDGTIIMERNYLLHFNNNNCFPTFSFYFDNDSRITIQYNNHSWANEYGLYIKSWKYGNICDGSGDAWIGNPMDKWIICPLIVNQWVSEKIIIESSGLVQYYMNGEYMGEHQFDDMNLDKATCFYIDISPFGWYPGHYHYMDDFTVSTPSSFITDNFNDGVIDLGIWQTPVNPDGVREEDGIIKMEMRRTDQNFHLRSQSIQFSRKNIM